MSKIREQYVDYINWAWGITFFIVASAFTKDIILDMLRKDVIRGVLIIILFLVSVAIFLLYLNAVRTELDLLDDGLRSEEMQVTEISGNVFLAMIALSIFLGLLIANSANIIYYSGLAALYSIFDIYGQSVVIRNFSIQIRKKNYRDTHLKEKEIEVLFDYYVGKPLLTRIAVILALECVAFTISIYSTIPQNILGLKLGHNISYIIMIVTFVVSEWMIYNWRKSRNIALQDIREQRRKKLVSETKTQE